MDNTPPINDDVDQGIVSEIIQKNRIKEFDEKDLEKIEKGESVVIPGAVISDIAMKLTKKEISDEVAVSKLQEYLNISTETANSVVKDVKLKLTNVPPVEKKSSSTINDSLPIRKDRAKLTVPKVNTATKTEYKKDDSYREPI